MSRIRIRPGIGHLMPFFGLVLALVGVADITTWLFIRQSLAPGPLGIVPLVFGVLLYRNFSASARRRAAAS